jgi:hypothetical protein
VIAGSAFLALSMSAAIFLVGDYLFSRWIAVVATVASGVAFTLLWFGLPLARRITEDKD